MSLIEDDYTVSCDLLVAEKNLKISTAEDAKRICDAIKQLDELKTLKVYRCSGRKSNKGINTLWGVQKTKIESVRNKGITSKTLRANEK